MKLQVLTLYNKRVLSILLLFLLTTIYGQQITIDNKNDFILEISSKDQIIKLNKGEKKEFSANGITYLNVIYKNGKNLVKYIPIFLAPDESLEMLIFDNSRPIEFKGDNAALHNLIVNQQHYILYKNIAQYQNIYIKKNTRELINSTELVLADYFSKVKSSLNFTKIMRGSSQYIEIENYITTSWLSSLFFFITGEKILDNQSKELILYYFNKYIKKDIDRYKCEYDGQYNVINELAKYNKQLGIMLPRYDIKVSSGDDLINQYLPESCQKFYFIHKYNYYHHLDSPEQYFYKNILKEKFSN